MKTLKSLNSELKTAQTSLASAKSQVDKYQTKVDGILAEIERLYPSTPPITPTSPIADIPKPTIPLGAKEFIANIPNFKESYVHKSGDNYSGNVINPDCITVVQDPVLGEVLKFEVKPTDTGGVTENARAQCQTPMLYTEGDDVIVEFSVKWDTFFWTWFQTISEIYGYPFKGTSPFRIGVQQSTIIASIPTKPKETHLWEHPLETNKWFNFRYRQVLSKDPKKGIIQMWLKKEGEDDYKEVIPVTNIPTIIDSNIDGPNYHKIACYYDKEHTFTDSSQTTPVDKIVMYFANHKVYLNS